MMSNPGEKGTIKIIIDTDIGDDIDDAIALSFALGSPEFEILGVTTVYGEAELRARVARRLCNTWGRDDIPVHVGLERPLAFEFHPDTVPENPSQRDAVKDMPCMARTPGAVDFIAETVNTFPGEVNILTIGAMTNIGALFCKDPSLADKIPAVISLAGYMPPRLDRPEWNVKYDPPAAQIIAKSGVNWVAIPADVQGQNKLQRNEIDALGKSDIDSAQFLTSLIVLMAHNKAQGNLNIHSFRDVQQAHVADVMTLAYFLVPDQMGLKKGTITVADRGGFSFKEHEEGPHTLATEALAEDSFRPIILARLLHEAV
jgi:purine nucleosidase/pyrimidine-specific ribonucleoside hydrolase